MTVDNRSKPPNPVYSLNISKRIQQGSPLLVPASLVPAHNRECILGKRRIWGTMKSCSALTVKIALQRLTAMSEKVTVKRRYKQMNGSGLRWWCIVSGEEKDLSQLELEWGRVQIQTSWNWNLATNGPMMHIPLFKKVQPKKEIRGRKLTPTSCRA